jgi:hypothetical protein
MYCIYLPCSVVWGLLRSEIPSAATTRLAPILILGCHVSHVSIAAQYVCIVLVAALPWNEAGRIGRDRVESPLVSCAMRVVMQGPRVRRTVGARDS